MQSKTLSFLVLIALLLSVALHCNAEEEFDAEEFVDEKGEEVEEEVEKDANGDILADEDGKFKEYKMSEAEMRAKGLEVVKVTKAPTQVVGLSADNFDTAVLSQSSEMWFVMFYAPWCSLCSHAGQQWDEVSKMRNTPRGHGANMGRVDCTAHGALCRRFAINQYPTAILFFKGRMHWFTDERSMEKMNQFLGKLAPDFTETDGQPIPPPQGLISEAKFWFKLVKDAVLELYDANPAVFIASTIGFVSLVVGIQLLVGYFIPAPPASPTSPAASAPVAAKQAAKKKQ